MIAYIGKQTLPQPVAISLIDKFEYMADFSWHVWKHRRLIVFFEQNLVALIARLRGAWNERRATFKNSPACPAKYHQLFLASVLFVGIPAFGAEPPMDKQKNGMLIGTPYDRLACSPAGVGLGGYDLISYRLPTGPVRGRVDLSVEHEGTTYLFSSDEHRQKFLARPVYYLPEYDGWCAISLALGQLTCPDFTNFKVEDGRLLLFEITGFTNGQAVWDSDPPMFRRQADSNFLLVQKPQ